MALDERDYMRERAAAQFSEWLGETSPATDPALSPGQTTKSNAVPAVIGLALLALGGYWLLARSPTPQAPLPSIRQAQGQTMLLDSAKRSVPAPRPRVAPAPAAPPVVEPPSSTAPAWAPGSESGRLVVIAPSNSGSAHIRISRDGVSWAGYVRNGETATVELVPGRYLVELVSRTGGASAPVEVTVESPSSTVTLSLTTGR